MKMFWLGMAWALVLGARVSAADLDPAVGRLVTGIVEQETRTRNLPFAQVIHAATGRKVIPLDRQALVDQALLGKLGQSLDDVLVRMNAADTPVGDEDRVNGVTPLFEKTLLEALGKVKGFQCAVPATVAGRTLKTGYPALCLRDQYGGRVVYLDVKLRSTKSISTGTETFTYTPHRELNKIAEDAHHLLLLVEHNGRRNGFWQFTRWEMIDLSRVELKLDASFAANRKDFQKTNYLVGVSRPAADRKPTLKPGSSSSQ
jgi:hypothetical protein